VVGGDPPRQGLEVARHHVDRVPERQ
jgi:hypothetical protein